MFNEEYEKREENLKKETEIESGTEKAEETGKASETSTDEKAEETKGVNFTMVDSSASKDSSQAAASQGSYETGQTAGSQNSYGTGQNGGSQYGYGSSQNTGNQYGYGTSQNAGTQNGYASSQNTGSQGGTGSGGSGSGGGGGGLVGVQAPLQNNIDSVDENNQPSGNSGFSDLDEAEWARDAVETLAEKGVISGDGDGRFRPNDTVTREEFVKMLMEASGIASEGVACPFVDVFKNDWFYSYVGAARQAGIVSGLSDSIFGVGLKISRQDAAVMINRAADYVGKNLVSAKEYTSFSDEGQIAEYAADAVRKLYECGVISGMEDGSFRPQGLATRAEAAVMFTKLIYALLANR